MIHEPPASTDTASPVRTGAIPLTQLARGQAARLESCSLSDVESAELRAMGLRPECEFRVCKMGEPCIVSIGTKAGGCRIALSRKLADRVHVLPC